MTCIKNNEVNNISGFNLLHDIINPPKRAKNLNIHYSLILHGFMNTRRGKVKFKNFGILLDSGCSSMVLMVRLLKNRPIKRCYDAVGHTNRKYHYQYLG